MRNEVKIDGVILTRAQIERAQAELNKPEPLPEPRCLQRVRFRRTNNKQPGVVITGAVQQAYVKGQGNFPAGPYTVVNDIGGGHTFETAQELWQVFEPVEEAKDAPAKDVNPTKRAW